MNLLCDRQVRILIFVLLLVPLKSLFGQSGIFHFWFYLLTDISVAREKMFSIFSKGISSHASFSLFFKKNQSEKLVKSLMFFFIQIF